MRLISFMCAAIVDVYKDQTHNAVEKISNQFDKLINKRINKKQYDKQK